MIKYTIFKRREPKRYDYMPRYYDPEKEDLEHRIRKAKADMGIKDENGQHIRREMNFRAEADAAWRDGSGRSKQLRAANFRLIIILAAISVLFYYIYTKLDIFVENLM